MCSSDLTFSTSELAVLTHEGANALHYSLISKKLGILSEYSPTPYRTAGSGIRDAFYITDDSLFQLYVKDADRYPKPQDRLLHPFKNGYTVIKCAAGGTCLIDSMGEKYPGDYCLPYDSLSEVIQGNYTLAYKAALVGIINIHTGETILPVRLQAIRYDGKTLSCMLYQKQFTLSIPQASKKLFDCSSGACDVYQELLKAIN